MSRFNTYNADILLSVLLIAVITGIYFFPLIFPGFAAKPLFYYLLLILVTAGSGLLLWKKEKIIFRVSDILLAVWALYVLILSTAHSIGYSFYRIAGFGVCVVVYILVRSLNSKYYLYLLKTIVYTAVAESFIVILQWRGFIFGNHPLFSVTGSFANPALSGCLLSIGFTVSLYYFLKNRQEKYFWLWNLSLPVIGISLYLTDSRAAWTGALIGSCIILYRLKFEKYRYKIIIICSFVLAIAVSSIFLYGYKKDSADGRLFIWKNTLTACADNFLTGHGPGAFEREYIYYQSRYFENNPGSQHIKIAGNPSSAFNEYLKILFEEGVLGLLLVAFLLVNTFFYQTNGS